MSFQKIRITLVISSLDCGGAERVMSGIANYWVKQNREITLLTFSSKLPFYFIDSRVNYISLGIAQKKSDSIFMKINNNINTILVLRDAILKSQPDVIISFMDKVNIITLLSVIGVKIPVIVMERSNPFQHNKGWVLEKLRLFTYARAKKIGVVSKQYMAYFPNSWHDKLFSIPNPVFLEPVRHTIKIQNNIIVAVGRLSFEKGFDILLKAFAKIKDKHCQWKLFILGEGSLRSELEILSQSLKIEDRVAFLGEVKEIYPYLKQANLFVLSSRYEGFPNALCEAMACGLPVISTDCSGGVREIIRHEVDGLLVPNEDVSALAAAMDRLMSDESERKRLAARAPEVTERFSLEKVMGMWENLLTEVVAKAKYDKHI